MKTASPEMQVSGVAACLGLVTDDREPTGTCAALTHLPPAAHCPRPQGWPGLHFTLGTDRGFLARGKKLYAS